MAGALFFQLLTTTLPPSLLPAPLFASTSLFSQTSARLSATQHSLPSTLPSSAFQATSMLSLLSLLALSSVASVATAREFLEFTLPSPLQGLRVYLLNSFSPLLASVPAHPFTNIVARADTAALPGGATIPAACESTCASTLQIYGYCLDASTQCLNICTEDGFNQFYECLNCAFQYESFNATQYVQIQATASTLVSTLSALPPSLSPTPQLS